jgi:Uncharacterised nucleotidyltransferase
VAGGARFVNRFVWLTGRLAPSEDDLAEARSQLAATPDFDPQAMLDIALTQGVIPQVCRSVASIDAPAHAPLERFLELADEYLTWQRGFIDGLLRDLDSFTASARDAGARFLAIKGTGVMARYPAGSRRLMRDVDLLVDPRAGWEAMRIVAGLGYTVRRVRIERFPYTRLDPGLYGIAETVDDPFDLHFGAFPGVGDSALEAGLFDRAQASDAHSAPIPSVEDSLLILAMHLTRHGSIKLRDLNDVYACVGRDGAGVDWDYVVRTAEANSLSTVVYSLLSTVQREFALPGLDPVSRRFRPGPAGRVLPRLMVRIGDRDHDFEFNPNQVFVGRLTQAAFLYRYLRPHLGGAGALRQAAEGLYWLVRTGRPYRLWEGRQVRDPARDGRIVIVALRPRVDGAEWEVERVRLDAVAEHARARGVSAREIAHEVVAWGAGEPDELLVTPIGIHVQSPYDGELSATDRARAECLAGELLADLIEARIVEARPAGAAAPELTPQQP